MGQHRTLVHLFPSFQKHITIFTTNKCENPYSIQCQDSNSQRLEHKSPPITTRPGLPPLVERMFTFKILALSIPPKGNSSSNKVLLYRLRSSDARALFSFSFFLRSPSLSLSLSLSLEVDARPASLQRAKQSERCSIRVRSSSTAAEDRSPAILQKIVFRRIGILKKSDDDYKR